MTHEHYMRRCIQLALLGKGYVAPNPLVGAVLVYDGIIIGEGYHQEYGQAHAEVNCINSVKEELKKLIPISTLYVSLEPCVHFGKTPPCVDFILQHRISKVIIGCSDPFKLVHNKGIEKLRTASVEVLVGVLEKECQELNKHFFQYHIQHRPYIVLKWAQTADGYVSYSNNKRIYISNDISNLLVHKYRSELASVLIGTNTALYDNPLLTNRFWKGVSPIRLLLDLNLKIPRTHHLFDKQAKTIVFNAQLHNKVNNLIWYKIERKNIPQEICNALFALNIQSVCIEGGTQLLQSFIQNNLWNEAIIITNTILYVKEGLAAPILNNALHCSSDMYMQDKIQYYQHV